MDGVVRRFVQPLRWPMARPCGPQLQLRELLDEVGHLRQSFGSLYFVSLCDIFTMDQKKLMRNALSRLKLRRSLLCIEPIAVVD